MAKAFSKGELRRPDRFMSFFDRLYQKWSGQGPLILSVIAAAVVVILATVGWLNFKKQQNQKAADALALVLKEFPSADSQSKDWGEFLKQLDQVAKDHSSSSLKSSIEIYRGRTLLQMGKYSEAYLAFQNAGKSLGKPYVYLAKEGQAFALMGQKRWNEAIFIWKNLFEAQDNPLRAYHAWNLGLSQEGAERIPEAVQTYQKFETQFSNSPIIENVRTRLVLLKQTPSTP